MFTQRLGNTIGDAFIDDSPCATCAHAISMIAAGWLCHSVDSAETKAVFVVTHLLPTREHREKERDLDHYHHDHILLAVVDTWRTSTRPAQVRHSSTLLASQVVFATPKQG